MVAGKLMGEGTEENKGKKENNKVQVIKTRNKIVLISPIKTTIMIM